MIMNNATKVGSKYWAPIGEGSETVTSIIESAANGGLWAVYTNGVTSEAHRLLIIRAVRGLIAQGLEDESIDEILAKAPFIAGNSSAAGQWLDNNIQVSSTGEHGSFKSFRKAFGQSSRSSAKLNLNKLNLV